MTITYIKLQSSFQFVLHDSEEQTFSNDIYPGFCLSRTSEREWASAVPDAKEIL